MTNLESAIKSIAYAERALKSIRKKIQSAIDAGYTDKVQDRNQEFVTYDFLGAMGQIQEAMHTLKIEDTTTKGKKND